MVDFKTRLGISLIVALAIAIMIYALLNPIVVWYLTYVPGFFTCSANTTCDIIAAFIGYGAPILALFLCVASVFEVFLK